MILLRPGLISKNEYSDNWCRRFYWIKLYIQLVKKNKEKVIALDKLTYAGNLDNFKNIEDSPFFVFFMVILAIVTLLDITSKNINQGQ